MHHFITNLFNIDEFLIESISILSKPNLAELHITLIIQKMDCPYCHGHSHVHGFSKPKRINHSALNERKMILVFHNRRYRCNECLRTFSAPNPFSFPTFKNSYLTIQNIMIQLSNLNYSYKMIAENNNISITQVQRYLDSFVNFPRITLPESIGIDEIHSKMAKRSNSAFLCVMVDNQNRCLFELLPSRSKNELNRYFDKIPKEEKNKVRFVTMDMWEPYKNVVHRHLKNAIIAIDPFHVVEHLMDSFRRVRLNIISQVEYNSDAYYLLKKWKDLIEKEVFLDNEPVYNSHFKKKLNKRQLFEMILDISENLALAYRLKEIYLNFNKNAMEKDCEEWFDSVLDTFKEADLYEYRDFISTLENWRTEILHSFKRPYENRKLSNALSENINGQLRTYLTISNGITNFTRFRKRCILALNRKVFYSISDRLRTDKYQGEKRGKYNKQ